MSEKATYIIDLKDAFSPKLSKASHNLDMFEGKIKAFGGSSGGGLFGEFSAAFTRAMAPLAIAAGVAMFTGKLVTMGMELEKTQVQLEVLVGSAERANLLFNEMADMAIATPFGTSDITDAGNLLLSFGADVESVMPTLSMLGDVAKGDANKMHLVTLAFAQMSSTGRLMGQDLLQMINAGFNPLQVIADQLGHKDLKILKKAMEDGAISADMVKEAFIIATSEGGRFHDMMNRIAETASGQWATFTGEIEHAFATMGKKTLPLVVEVLKALRHGFDMLMRVDYSAFTMNFEQLFDVFKGLSAELGNLWNMFGLTTDGMTGLQVAVQYFAGAMRIAMTPLKLLIEGFKILLMLGQTLIDVFKGLGLMLAGILSRDMALFNVGLGMAVDSAKTGFQGLFDEIKGFAQSEKEGWQKIFTMGTPDAEKQETELQRFGRTAGVFDSLKGLGAGKGKDGKKSGVDGEVRSGGVKNITINITQLVGEINFETLDNISETKVVEMVKRALLTAVNDANVAVQ